MDFDEFLSLMQLAISSKKFNEIEDILRKSNVSLLSITNENKDIVQDWLWNNFEIPAKIKWLILANYKGFHFKKGIKTHPQNADGKSELHFAVEEYSNYSMWNKATIDNFEQIANECPLRQQILRTDDNGITPFAVAYKNDRNDDVFQVGT